MASWKLSDFPSCISREWVRTPQSGGVRSFCAVSWPPFWTMPSPVPRWCNRKSLNGWKTLFPRASGTVNVPLLMLVPGGTVVSERTWQMAQPT